MSLTSIHIDDAVDMAVERLPLIRRRVLQRRLRNADYRRTFTDELLLKLHDDEDCCAIGMQTTIAAGEREFGFDPANLQKFLEIIIKYLPQLLAIILPLFMSLLPLIALLLLPTGNAAAQTTVCENGVCYQIQAAPSVPRPAVQAVGNVVGNVVGQVAKVATTVLPPYPAIRQQVANRSVQQSTYYTPTHQTPSYRTGPVRGLVRRILGR
jgi:hypothetical protein